jgi:hypothetical protein
MERWTTSIPRDERYVPWNEILLAIDAATRSSPRNRLAVYLTKLIDTHSSIEPS